MTVIKKEENEQSQFLMNRNLHIDRKQTHGGHSIRGACFSARLIT